MPTNATNTTNNKIKRLPLQLFIGAYQGVTAAREIERIVTDEEWDQQSVICTNMAIATKDIAGKTRIRELGNPQALEAAASGAILGGLIGGMSRLMIGNANAPDKKTLFSKRPSVLAIAQDPNLFEDEKRLEYSKRPSIVARVAEHNVQRMDQNRLDKIGASLTKGSSAIVCVFDEVLVTQNDYETHMVQHQQEMSDVTDYVTSKISEQLRAGNDVAFHIVVDEASGDISWTRTVVGEDAIQVRDIVLKHDSLALAEVTTAKDDSQTATQEVVVTPEAVATARSLLRQSVCAYEVSYEDLVDDPDFGITAGDQEFETGLVRTHPDGSQAVLYQQAKVKGGDKTFESRFEVTKPAAGTTERLTEKVEEKKE